MGPGECHENAYQKIWDTKILSGSIWIFLYTLRSKSPFLEKMIQTARRTNGHPHLFTQDRSALSFALLPDLLNRNGNLLPTTIPWILDHNGSPWITWCRSSKYSARVDECDLWWTAIDGGGPSCDSWKFEAQLGWSWDVHGMPGLRRRGWVEVACWVDLKLQFCGCIPWSFMVHVYESFLFGFSAFPAKMIQQWLNRNEDFIISSHKACRLYHSFK